MNKDRLIDTFSDEGDGVRLINFQLKGDKASNDQPNSSTSGCNPSGKEVEKEDNLIVMSSAGGESVESTPVIRARTALEEYVDVISDTEARRRVEEKREQRRTENKGKERDTESDTSSEIHSFRGASRLSLPSQLKEHYRMYGGGHRQSNTSGRHGSGDDQPNTAFEYRHRVSDPAEHTPSSSGSSSDSQGSSFDYYRKPATAAAAVMGAGGEVAERSKRMTMHSESVNMLSSTTPPSFAYGDYYSGGGMSSNNNNNNNRPRVAEGYGDRTPMSMPTSGQSSKLDYHELYHGDSQSGPIVLDDNDQPGRGGGGGSGGYQGDIAYDLAGDGKEMKQKGSTKMPSRKARLIGILIGMGLLTIGLLVSAILLWPRDPTIKITKLEVLQPTQVRWNQAPGNNYQVTFGLRVSYDFRNNNFYHYTPSEIDINVSIPEGDLGQSRFVLGPDTKIGRRSTIHVAQNVYVQANSTNPYDPVVKSMMLACAPPSLQLPYGHSPANVTVNSKPTIGSNDKLIRMGFEFLVMSSRVGLAKSKSKTTKIFACP